MTNFAHTPGPRILSQSQREYEHKQVDAGGRCIAAIQTEDAVKFAAENGANARLIEAAPDYDQAAQAVLDNWERGDLAAAVRLLATAHALARESL